MNVKLGLTLFDGPFPLNTWIPAREAGVYAILAPAGGDGRALAPIHIGHSQDLSECGFPLRHEMYPRWLDQVASGAQLFVGVLPMPKSSPQERDIMAEELVLVHRPVCND